MLRQLFLSRRGTATLTPRRHIIAPGLRLRSLALRSTSKPRFSGSQHVFFSAPLPQLSTISGNQTGEKSVSQKNNKEQHTGPLTKWTKAEVQDWLEKLKVDEELKFDVASVAAPGHLFAKRTKEDLVMMADGPVGIHIFISKEELLAREKEAQAGQPLKGEETTLLNDAVTWLRGVDKKRGSIVEGVFDDPYLDLRPEASSAFDACLQAVDELHHNPNNMARLKSDSVRVPIAVNSGTTGSGKTIQLLLICAHFEGTQGGSHVYATFNGDDSYLQSFDRECSVPARVTHRLLHAASGSKHRIDLFVSKLRQHLGMARAGCQPATVKQEDLEEWLCDPKNVMLLCRGAMELDDHTPLLLAVDELRKLGEEPPVGEKSNEAVGGLRFLAKVVQQGVIWAKSESGRAPTYGCASAYAAYDPMKGMTEGSNVRVFWMPLPPLSLGKREKKLAELAGGNKAQKLVGRSVLWLSQGNARELDNTFGHLIELKAENWSHDTHQAELDRVWNETEAPVRKYLSACRRSHADPTKLLRNLFWPLKCEKTTQFSVDMDAALLAEAAGLCSILRSEAGFDSVYMHPTAARRLCEKIEMTESMCDFAPLPVVKQLCIALEALPVDLSGKLYEHVITLTLACRLATSFESIIKVGDLVGENSGGPLFEARLKTPTVMREESVPCFPRAAEWRKDDGTWRNVACPIMPETPTPWYAVFTDEHSVCFDSVVTAELFRPTDHHPHALALIPQMKEHSVETTFLWDDAFRKKRAKQLEWSQPREQPLNVARFTANHELVHVYVTPNQPEGFEPEATTFIINGKEFTCHEALMTHHDIRKWSPMVAYSGCDARVLRHLTHNISLQEPSLFGSSANGGLTTEASHIYTYLAN